MTSAACEPIVPSMRALFLADAHLHHPDDANYRALLSFLEAQRGRIDLLGLLGDIFEFWAGDRKHLHPYYRPLIDCLEQLNQNGTELVYVEGNHDFDLGRHFIDRLNCKVFPNGGMINLEGVNIFLAHGDQANPADKGYHFLRWFLRTPMIRTLIRHLPEKLVWRIADKSVETSRKNSKGKNRQWPAREILRDYARTILDDQCSVLITGHFHQPFQETLEQGELIALGDWIDQFSYLAYENGRFELRTYSSLKEPGFPSP